LAFAILRLVLLAGLLAALFAFLGLLVRFGVGFRLGEVEGGQQPARSTSKGLLVGSASAVSA
jgi:hypothetical protein